MIGVIYAGWLSWCDRFYIGLPKRLDGRLLLVASILSAILLLANIFPGVAASFGLVSKEKWIALWVSWPFVLFVAHLRLRSLSDRDDFIAAINHSLVMLGSTIYLD